MKHILVLLISLCCLCSVAQAQVDVQLTPARHDFVAGENVVVRVTLTNHTDGSIAFGNRPGRPWLNFIVTKRGETVPVSGFATPKFPAVTLTPGAKRSFEVNLSEFYHLLTTGTYGVTASVRLADGVSSYSSTRSLFALIGGGKVRSYRVRAGGKNLEMNILLVNIDKKDDLFGQVVNADTNRVVGACFLGRYLNFMKPSIMLDAAQNLHVLCQSSPDFYTYSVMNTQGKRSFYKLYRRTAGPVSLISTGKGVKPVGVAPYVKPKVEDIGVHKTSERPF